MTASFHTIRIPRYLRRTMNAAQARNAMGQELYNRKLDCFHTLLLVRQRVDY